MNLGINTTRSRNSFGIDCRNWKRFSTPLATLLACAVLLPLLGHKPLTNWDEGIYAEISREMLSLGPLVPHWNYQPWFEKPPLMLWITAAFFKVFGVTEFWARAGSAFSGVAIVSLLHAWLVRRSDILAAWLSTMILLSTFGFLHVCRVGEMDVLLSLGCCIALCGLTSVQDGQLGGWYPFWAGMAVALMTKGAACIVLVLAALVFAGLERWNSARFGKSFWLALALFLAAVLPWHLYMLNRFGESFVDEYLGLHVLARATHQIEDHVTHWWYYLWVLLLSAVPFVLLYPFAIVDSLRRRELRAWAVFAVVVLSFFTFVQTRLPHYIAPAYPVLAMLTAVFLADRFRALAQRSKLPPVHLWFRFIVAGMSICLVSVLVTSGPRRKLHQAKVGPDVVFAEKESIVLLRDVYGTLQPVSGPLLVWWQGNTRSIATSIFYSRRPVQQVELQPAPAGVLTDKYFFQPEMLERAGDSGRRIILLDKYLVPQIPSDFSYRRIVTGRWMEVGIIKRR